MIDKSKDHGLENFQISFSGTPMYETILKSLFLVLLHGLVLDLDIKVKKKIVKVDSKYVLYNL